MAINFHNDYHLGDHIFNCILFYNIQQYIENNNIFINYYALPEYLNEITQFICCKNINIYDIKTKPLNSIHLWIENNVFDITYAKMTKPFNYNLFLKKWFNNVMLYNNIPFNFDRFFYKDTDLLIRYDNMKEKYKNIDILYINSVPKSGQFNYIKDNWNYLARILQKKYKIITTTKVDNINCTMDDNLFVKDIAAISTKAKIIIAVNSGVVPGLLNIYTLKNVKKVYIFDDNVFYSYPNFESKKKLCDISLLEISTILNY